MDSINTTDLIVIFLYFLLIFGIGYWAFKKRKDESADYFLAGRDVGWLAVGASLFASNIGSEHLVGLAGSGAAGGLAVGHFEWLACLILLLLGWVFVPFYLRSGVYTMPEFLERRYNPAARWYLATISVVGYVLTKISVTLFAGAIVIRELTGFEILTSAVILVLITGFYTVAGGLRAVVYTEVVQTFVLIFGSLALTIGGLIQIGGWEGLEQNLPPDFFSMWKSMDHPDFPWTGIVFGAPILGIWYWCTDQYIVQRVLAARNIAEARTGTVFAGFLKILPVFIFVLPGMIAAALFQDISGGASDRAFPALVTRILPVGLKGLVIAGLLAALMSSLSSVFNSCSTLITWDFYKKMRPNASERSLVLVGRIATAILVILGLLWIPFMKYISSQLYIYLQSVQAYIAPPIAACFLFGLFLPRLNGTGAIASLLTGFVVGAMRLILELMNGADKTGLPQGTLWEWLAEINFLHFAVFLFIACTAILIGISYLSQSPNRDQLRGLTFATIETGPEVPPTLSPESFAKRRRLNQLLTGLLIAAIGVLWIVFA
ncbi:MAG TPA: sodium:solute symporter [Bacteroidota bacterium]|nr:sodium:solute symporter [Bacteroidota bacterium]